MYESAKRAVDFVFALVGLVLLSPLLAVVAILVAFDVGFPVLFQQMRPGQNSKSFRLVKFRTMREPREGEDPLASDSERLTGLGRSLRATSIDELPELWNVVRGEMSLVGPRPLLPDYLSVYTARQARRHEVKPGITGWAQVNGRNATTWADRLELDVWYVDHRSFALDTRILAKTVRVVLSRKGIAMEGTETAHRFDRE